MISLLARVGFRICMILNWSVALRTLKVAQHTFVQRPYWLKHRQWLARIWSHAQNKRMRNIRIPLFGIDLWEKIRQCSSCNNNFFAYGFFLQLRKYQANSFRYIIYVIILCWYAFPLRSPWKFSMLFGKIRCYKSDQYFDEFFDDLHNVAAPMIPRPVTMTS